MLKMHRDEENAKASGVYHSEWKNALRDTVMCVRQKF